MYEVLDYTTSSKIQLIAERTHARASHVVL